MFHQKMGLPKAEKYVVATAIRRAIVKGVGAFDIEWIAYELRSVGLDISNVKIGNVLRRMRKKGELRILQRGGGGAPNRYVQRKEVVRNGNTGGQIEGRAAPSTALQSSDRRLLACLSKSA